MNALTSFGITISDDRLLAELGSELEMVEEILWTATESESPSLTEISRHLLTAGGKRFRPLITLLASRFGPERSSKQAEIVAVAAALELTHVASLYHDDVMDQAEQRRGVSSVHTVWDEKTAILGGDLLVARANGLTSRLGSRVHAVLSHTGERLVSGQLRELMGPEQDEDSIKHYLDVVQDKTGALIAACCELGAFVAGADEEHVGVLRQFGEELGVCFQLADDVLDIASDGAVSGKGVGTDLRQGVRTLPVLYVLGSDDVSDVRLRELLLSDLSSDEAVAEALGLLRQHSAVERARGELLSRIGRVEALLGRLPECSARTSLLDVLQAASWRVR